MRSKSVGVKAQDLSGRWSGRHSPKELRREQILRSVGEVLRDSGLSSLSMADIATRLGITKGNLYYYFKNKRDILYQCHMRSMGISLDALKSVDERADPCERLRVLLVRHIKGIIDSGMGSVLLTDLENLDAKQRKTYVALRDKFEVGVLRLIEEGRAQGLFACPDPKLATLTMLGAVNWIPKWYRVGGRLAPDDIANGVANLLVNTVAVAASR